MLLGFRSLIPIIEADTVPTPGRKPVKLYPHSFFQMGQTHGLVAAGNWKTVQTKRNKRIGSWTDDNTGASILFEFRKNGQIKMYHDDNKNGKLNRRRDTLIGEAKFSKWDKDHYGRRNFLEMESGSFEIEVEGWTNDKGEYEAWYSTRLDTGVDRENFLGSMLDVNKFVDMKNQDYLTSIFQPDL